MANLTGDGPGDPPTSCGGDKSGAGIDSIVISGSWGGVAVLVCLPGGSGRNGFDCGR